MIEDLDASEQAPTGLLPSVEPARGLAGSAAAIPSAARHTPGPWSVEPVMDPNDLSRPWVGRISEQRYAALSCGADLQEAQANARLIAAAPAMLTDGKFLADRIAELEQDLIGGTEVARSYFGHVLPALTRFSTTLASAIEARRGETEGLDQNDESAVPQADAK